MLYEIVYHLTSKSIKELLLTSLCGLEQSYLGYGCDLFIMIIMMSHIY